MTTLDMTSRPKSSRTVNRMLREHGIHGVSLVRGNGYWWFDSDESGGWPSTSVAVYRITDLTLQGWLDEYRYLSNPENWR